MNEQKTMKNMLEFLKILKKQKRRLAAGTGAVVLMASMAATKASAKEVGHTDENSQIILDDPIMQRLMGGLIVDPTLLHPLGSMNFRTDLKWVSVNDAFEERYTPDGLVTGRRNHSYEVVSEDIKSNNNKTHDKIIALKCKTCGHETTLTETYDCEFDKGTKNGNKTIYKCEVDGCGYSYSKTNTSSVSHGGSTSSHTHSYGEWVSLDDEFEYATCACGNAITRSHEYKNSLLTINTNNDETHNIIIEEECSNCNHSKTTIKNNVPCTFNEGVISDDKTKITYTCLDCGYEKVADYTHTHSEAPSNLIYSFDSSNNDGTHRLKASYECATCGEVINLYKIEDCIYSNDSIIEDSGLNEPYNHHYVVDVCDICNYENRTIEPCTKVGEKKYIGLSGNTYEYYECGVCGGYVDRMHHVKHNYGDWKMYDAAKHRSECPCGDSSEIAGPREIDDYHDMFMINGEMVCSGCGYSVPSMCEDHLEDGMDLMDIIFSPHYGELVSKSQIPNVEPSPDDYCSRYVVHCAECGAYYSIHYNHNFVDGKCTRIGYCGGIEEASYSFSNNASDLASLETSNNDVLKLERKLNNSN